MEENIHLDYKSISFITRKNPDWNELAKDSVAFANREGGAILIGIEDGENLPPENQTIDNFTILEKIQNRIAELTIQVRTAVSVEKADNGSEYIKVSVFRSEDLASTTDGKYYLREGDKCKPVLPDEIARLAAEKSAFVWELQTTQKLPSSNVDLDKQNYFIKQIRQSDRVSDFVKEKSDTEILDYFFLLKDHFLTNLGILWIGKRSDRASMLYPPAIQIIKFDETENKVWKKVLGDYELNPYELLIEVSKLSDWEESTEITEGIFRKNIPVIPWEAVRELVANALVHRTYTTRGDIFINIYPDRLEIHSPGRLPFGVTPKNILNQSVRRNEHLSQIFYALKLMEKEGSGYDLVYEKLLETGKHVPKVTETSDRVTVVINKQIVSKTIIHLMDKASNEFQLRQRETICLGLIAQHQPVNALQLSTLLNISSEDAIINWIGRLSDFNLVIKKGKAKGMYYSVNPKYMSLLNIKGKTNLVDIEDYRLEELLYKDITAYPESSFGDIHKRIGEEINKNKVRRLLSKMLTENKLFREGVNRYSKYSAIK
ncbi:ATP-binding protein [Chryseobacterium sp. 5_R23647]|uniref:ATP-binding protein n=1 Tax=Chryseobacterium sp. 5_R23647 TaxID=2258964 RepID=UPI000E266ABE|nr:ATP-binding protein [Chryseobacterium sp. 5_R23647]REC40902.1 transcriptional regulator [Chryseobacterium sp. 5_R23647]